MRSAFTVLLAIVLASTAACSAADVNETANTEADESVSSSEEALVTACTTNADCGSTGSYCKLKECTAPGACTTRPLACPSIYLPVCGCDNKTYGNSCSAARAGVSVKHNGAWIRVQ